MLALIALFVFLNFAAFVPASVKAKRYIQAVHADIESAHPIFLEDKAQHPEFFDWHENGYAEALSMADSVETNQDVSALLKFYLNGYQEPHLGGSIKRSSPLSLFSSKKQLSWLGWLLSTSGSGFHVVVSDSEAESGTVPPVGAQILSCDGVDIDTILQTHYAPYFDRRWQVLRAKIRAAWAFSMKSGDHFNVLNRPTFKTCNFLFEGEITSYDLSWKAYSGKSTREAQRVFNLKWNKFSYKRFYKTGIWINLRSFQMKNGSHYRSFQNLLSDLSTIEKPQVVVFDIRGNGGGNSSYGESVLKAILPSELAEHVYAKRFRKQEGANAYFRTSEFLHKFHEHRLEKLIKDQGPDSSSTKYAQNFLNKIKAAHDRGDVGFWQRDPEWEATIQNAIREISIDNSAQLLNKYNTQYIVVTSSSCFSACLDFMDIVMTIPGVIHMGQSTNSDTAYTEIARGNYKFFNESFSYQIPVKKWNKRSREDHEAFHPQYVFEGNINDTAKVKRWVNDIISEVGHHRNFENDRLEEQANSVSDSALTQEEI